MGSCAIFSVPIPLGEDETEMTIRGVFEETGMLVDPHTAVGIAASQQEPVLGTTPMVVLVDRPSGKVPRCRQARHRRRAGAT